jgi:hypothetical protein
MSNDNLKLCPKCNEGILRPTGKAGIDAEKDEPFREVGQARRYQCDNCGHIEFDASITERVGTGESLSSSVEKKDKS